jgi:DNA adenine methylase
MMVCERSKPFLKWPGGKSWLAPLLVSCIKHVLKGTYIEPFLGGGAVFFQLQPKKAILSDTNRELIECTISLRNEVDAIIGVIRRWTNDEECYYWVRKKKPKKQHSAAARLIYLTHTCWGGVYRVNKKGDFNVPFGNSGRHICDYKSLRTCSRILKCADIYFADFETIIDLATEGDVVYSDPPYTTLGQNNGFIRYNEHLFAWSDQKRLSRVSNRASKRGALIIVSGLWHKSILKLYKGWWAIPVSRYSNVSAKVEGRRRVTEALLFSRKPNFTSESTDEFELARQIMQI